jgi:pimeloyl-ACP methyl ester carboxylesterase
LRWIGPFRAKLAAFTFSFALLLPHLHAVDTAVIKSAQPSAPTNIVIGFTGGFVRHDNRHHALVQMGERLRQSSPSGTYVEVFENRRRKQAKRTIERLLDADGDGSLSEGEKTGTRIFLYGHSWGAASALLLARDLRRDGIPVALTVQVDSVAKPWQSDAVVPDNVAEAINIYQPHGMAHGREQIRAADPAKTTILGNIRMDYRVSPVQCPAPFFFDKLLTPDHMQSECDPHVWLQVEKMVRQRLAGENKSPENISGGQAKASR